MTEPSTTSTLHLLPGWGESLASAQAARLAALESAPRVVVPAAPSYYTQHQRVITTVAEASAFVDFALGQPVAHIGFDSEFRFRRAPWTDRRGRKVNDIRSVEPLLLSFALALPGASPEAPQPLAVAVADVRDPAVAAALGELFQLAVPIVAHFLSAELHVLKQLGLPEPRILWDTWACERAGCLGQFNAKYELEGAETQDTGDEDSDEASATEEAQALQVTYLSLLATCHRHGIEHRFATAKERLQQSFLDHAPGAAFTDEQIAYAAEDAIAAARLYLRQVAHASRTGLLYHLVSVEMPWVAVSSEIEWTGVRIDRDKASRIANACERHLPAIEARMRTLVEAEGVPTETRRGSTAKLYRQRATLLTYADRVGMGRAFRKVGHEKRYELTKNRLKAVLGADEVFDLLYIARRIDTLQKDCILDPGIVGADGRVHPMQQQLGADTGRQTTRSPNILGQPGILRPVVIPEDGFGIGEVDLTQIEVGVAAAVYGDQRLIDLFNRGDVYVGMVKLFLADQLSHEEMALSDAAFKKTKRLKALRNLVKTLTLGIIYGVTEYGIARSLGISCAQARPMLERFLGMFPALRAAQERHAQLAGWRGYAMTASGLRRYRGQRGRITRWERNWLNNMPVQAGAAVAFKIAGIRLRVLLRALGARLIGAVHDAYVVEAPLIHLAAATELTSRVLCEAVQECYPVLRPRAEISTKHPECWTKDDDATGWSLWLDDPLVMIADKLVKPRRAATRTATAPSSSASTTTLAPT